jgi:hypothetical protein
MLGLLALAHGVLVASLAELAGSRGAVRELQVRAASARGVRAALGGDPGPWMDSLGVWDARTTRDGVAGGVEIVGSLRRLGRESWLIEGTGRLSGGVSARTARLAWSLDPLTRIVALPAAVTVGPDAPVTLSGQVDAGAPTAVAPPMWEGECDPWLAALIARYAGSALLPVATVPAPGAPALGLLDFDALLALPSVTVTGSGTPAPSEAWGVCLVDGPWNWGDPDQPRRPCGSHLVLRRASGDLRVDGGVGQGVLIVDGGLTLDGGARFFGLVIASGDLRLEGGARLEGMALVSGGLVVAAGAVVRGSACWAVRALAAQRGWLGGLVPVVEAGGIGPL